ncbi:hypothetical protein TRVL_04734 [Trypanosoma vivax]|nr:hypothetical protein TRVL_04734 [Trypanosoma vivax]
MNAMRYGAGRWRLASAGKTCLAYKWQSRHAIPCGTVTPLEQKRYHLPLRVRARCGRRPIAALQCGTAGMEGWGDREREWAEKEKRRLSCSSTCARGIVLNNRACTRNRQCTPANRRPGTGVRILFVSCGYA